MKIQRKRNYVENKEKVIEVPTDEKIWNGIMIGGGTKWWNRNVTERYLYIYVKLRWEK